METIRKRRRDRDELHTGSLGSTWEHDWVVGLQILTAMREMLLMLEHTQENLIEVEDESKGEMAVSNRVELKVEENEVAIPIPPLGRLVPIVEAVQELPDELVGTQIAFDLADKDCSPSY